MSKLLILAAATVLMGSAGASAQGVYVERDDGAVYAAPPADDQVVVEREAAPPASRVYGWSGREPWAPANCGTYKYWNGEFCADARDKPSKQ